MMPVSVLAALALLLNAFVYGVAWWPFRLLQAQGLHPLWATSLIYVFALIVLALVRPQAWRGVVKHPSLWWLLLASGLTNVGFNWAVTVGDVVRVVLLFYLMPAWVVMLAWPLLGEKPTAASLLRLALALTGVVIVLKTPESAWPVPQSMADWLALMGGFCFDQYFVAKIQPNPTSLAHAGHVCGRHPHVLERRYPRPGSGRGHATARVGLVGRAGAAGLHGVFGGQRGVAIWGTSP